MNLHAGDDIGPSKASSMAAVVQTGLVTAVCLLVIVWMGLGWDVIKRRSTYHDNGRDYYSLLVHGFLKGHLYMDIVADPRLESPDLTVRESAPAPLDSSYFKGHFYLYYGVTPAALVLLPYSWLTGGDLDPRVAVVLFVVLGFLLSVGTWRMVARDCFGRLGVVIIVASVAALAFGTATPFLLTRAMFYELAEASVYACSMAACFWMYRALSGRGRPWLQVALASLSLALAVGCRPNLILALPVIAAVAIVVAKRDKAWPGIALAALLPAAVIGACLAIYNFERFGSPLDFGFKYGQNALLAAHHQLVSTRFVWANLHWYYLTFPGISPFFPYIFPCRAAFGPVGYQTGEAIHGQMPVFVLLAFVAFSACATSCRARIRSQAPFICSLGFMFVSVLIGLSVFAIRADRYMADFQPAMVLGVVILAGIVANALEGRRFGGLWKWCFGSLAILAAAFNLLAGIQEFDSFDNLRPATFAAMEKIGNIPSDWLAKLGLLHYGPIELKVRFPANLSGATAEPLMALGTPDLSDGLYINEYPVNQIQFMGEHLGYPEPRSELIQVTPGKTYTVRVEMGALYPPLNHPFFAPYGDLQARRMKGQIHVSLDGKPVLKTAMGSYDAPPWTLEIARNDISMSPARMSFSGEVAGVLRLPPPVPAKDVGGDGLWRIQCVFPMQAPGGNFPILSSGVTGNGTLLYVSILPENRVRFGVDEWGQGGGLSDPVRVDPAAEHSVEIFIGSLAGRTVWPAGWHISHERLKASSAKLRIWLDGQLVQTSDLFVPYSPKAELISVGANVQGFSTSSPEFEGPIESDPFPEVEREEFLDRNLQTGR
jgi:hypothetical protein